MKVSVFTSRQPWQPSEMAANCCSIHLAAAVTPVFGGKVRIHAGERIAGAEVNQPADGLADVIGRDVRERMQHVRIGRCCDDGSSGRRRL